MARAFFTDREVTEFSPTNFKNRIPRDARREAVYQLLYGVS